MDDNDEDAVWHLTPHERDLFTRRNIQTGRQIVQSPTPDMKPLDRGKDRVGGIEVGTLVALAALDYLAERGNRVARRMADKIRADQQINTPLISAPGVARQGPQPLKPMLVVRHVRDDDER